MSTMKTTTEEKAMRMLNPVHPGRFLRTEIIEAHDLSVTDAEDAEFLRHRPHAQPREEDSRQEACPTAWRKWRGHSCSWERSKAPAADFLRIRGGGNPLDMPAVHPESYRIVEKMAASLGVTV